MSALDDLKDRIDSAIYTNTEQNITGDGLQTVLDDMVDTMGVSVSQITETGKTALFIGNNPELIVDKEPEEGSHNLVESGGVRGAINNVEDNIGDFSNNVAYDSDDYSGIWWASNHQFIQLEDSSQYETFIVRVIKGQTINWSISSYIAINVFANKPIVGEYQERINDGTLTNPYIPDTSVYIMFMFQKSESMTLNMSFSSVGICKKIQDNTTAITGNAQNISGEVERAKASEDKLTSAINVIDDELTITDSLAGIIRTSKNYTAFKNIIKSIKIQIDDASLTLPSIIKLKIIKNSAGNYQTTIQFEDKDTENVVFSWYVNDGPLTGLQQIQIVGTGTLDTSVRLIALVNFDAISEVIDGTEFVVGKMNKEYCFIDNNVKDVIEGNFGDVTTLYANQYYSAANVASTGKMVDYRQTNNGVYCTRLDVKEGEQYRIFGYGLNNVVRFYAVTDESLNVLSTNSADINSRANGLILTMPANSKYLYINFVAFNSTTDRIEKYKLYALGNAIYANNLKGKTIAFFGDSITEFKGYDAMSYPEHFARISGANVLNFGIGGTQYRARVTPTGSPSNANEAWADVDISSLIKAISDNSFVIPRAGANWLNTNGVTNVLPIINQLQGADFSKIDIVVFLGGTNDWGSGAGYLGETGSTDSTKTLGAINNIVTGLLTAYPHLKIYVFTPIVRWGINTSDARTAENWCDVKQNSAGATLLQYVEAIKTEFEKYKLPICDLYHTLGWNQYNFGNYFNNTDGTHPYKGFKELSNKVCQFIISN